MINDVFKNEMTFLSHFSSKVEAPEMRDDWETSSSFKKHLELFYRYDGMFIKNLVMGRHNNVILENSDITKCVIDNA